MTKETVPIFMIVDLHYRSAHSKIAWLRRLHGLGLKNIEILQDMFPNVGEKISSSNPRDA